jgi:hypothetical protein
MKTQLVQTLGLQSMFVCALSMVSVGAFGQTPASPPVDIFATGSPNNSNSCQTDWANRQAAAVNAFNAYKARCHQIGLSGGNNSQCYQDAQANYDQTSKALLNTRASCIAQAQAPAQPNPPAAPQKRPPFQLGATDYGPDVLGADPGQGPPDEPGVDWNTWYKNWISLVDTQVFRPLDQHFAADRNSYTVTIIYEVSPNGNLAKRGGNWQGGEAYGTSAANLFYTYRLKAPPFPQGTKYTTLTRTFTFSRNWNKRTGIRLGGPPQG